jgi:hypothetical protein
MTLTDFLLARIAEDEASIRADLVGRDYPDPLRSFVECDVKRRVMELHRPHDSDPDYCVTCSAWEACGCMGGRPLHPCPTIKALALPYADHPDYRAEWKP